MERQDFADLAAFVSVARERSFSKAAAKMAITPSALSHKIRGLEERLGLRLLNRTTRSVTTTEAGQRLFDSVSVRFDEIDHEIATLSELREKPAGTVRINADDIAIETLLWPALRKVLPEYPDIKVELEVDNGLSDIVGRGFDAGVRLGGIVEKDMIAVPISPEMRMVAVASPAYFAENGAPSSPRSLTEHRCINMRLSTYGGLYAWEFVEGGREFTVRVDGPLIFNSSIPVLKAALDGFGIAYLLESHVQQYLDSGELHMTLDEWSPPFEGYSLYYPSRRQPTPAFSVIVNALRYRSR
ncbi:MAG: LysR family transcriptional regulator [Pseudomonas sp.]|uniref:LysR family transcriptional regulator n=1 Tax=Pseudomonas sp. TaxID=306 RepID=UPI0011F5679B|nr:LysR family transcriptional regulator [Pseudomonas sp.]RZI75930.1 MAG: LysR family transcriptional regulator [Pseudomonas sp.]